MQKKPRTPKSAANQSDTGMAEALAAGIEEADQAAAAFSIALTDIDRFMEVNDRFGRKTGDAVLEVLDATLHETLPAGGLVFRQGGDSFVVLLSGIDKESAFLWLEERRKSFAGEHTIGKNKRFDGLALSAAIATFPEDGTRPEELLRKADDAMYRAKATGRNRICLAREEKMVTKTSYYTQGQLERLSALARRENVGEASLLRAALDDLFRRYEI